MTAIPMTTEQVVTRSRMPAYPLSILIGCAALDEVDAFNGLPDGYWRVVTRLVKKISVATPFKAIFARRDTLANESGKSIETVGRALRWLEDEGLITRQQKARPGLRGSEAHLHPTPKLISALGIGQKSATANPSSPTKPSDPPPADTQDTNENDPELSTEPATESAVRNDGSVSALQVHSLLTKKQSDEARASTSTKTKTASQRQMTVIDGKVIPNDLVWMTRERGLPATGILRLMKLASKAGKRLSDIVTLCKAALASLRGKALFAYVRALIKQDKDYAYILRKTTDSEAAKHQRQQDDSLIALKAREWSGQRYITRDQQRIWLVADSGFILRVDGRESASRRMDIAFVDAVMNGELRRLAA